jgi:hypothetical protein
MRKLLRDLINRDGVENPLGSHSIMLASLVVLLVAFPIGRSVGGGGKLFSVLLSLVLIAAVLVNGRQRWIFVVAILAGIGSVFGSAYAEVSGSLGVRIASESLGLALLCTATLVMFVSLVRADRVSLDTIVGGICVYLLIGLSFALAFILMTDLRPGIFIEGDQAIVRAVVDSSAHALTLLYYSFVTLTTLGYGDVRPLGETARMLAVAEAVIGQLYLTIFVARLIATYVARDRIAPD